MRKRKCVHTTYTNKYTFTVGKIYESDDKGYGIKGDDGFIFDVTTASLSESLTIIIRPIFTISSFSVLADDTVYLC